MIVVADAAPSAVLVAAADLQQTVQDISAAKLPIVKASQLPPGDKRPRLLVGPSQAVSDLGIKLADLPPEGGVIVVKGDAVVLAGREDEVRPGQTQMGTQWAVSTFCEEVLGVAWLWPGDLGRAVPRQPTITVPEMSRTIAPAINQRRMRNGLPSKTDKLARAIEQAKPDFDKIALLQKDVEAWYRHLKLGGILNLTYGHAFTRWWERFHDTHPEYFAMQLDGSREWPTSLGGYDRVKLCVSNPAVIDQIVKDAQEFFAKAPYMDSISASPDDNAYHGHCMCDNCKALDPPDAEKVTLFSTKNGQRVEFEYPSLTDRYVHSYNAVAEKLAQIAPGKLVGGYAYGAWRAPPVREKVHPNVFIGFVGLGYLNDESLAKQRQQWDQWAKAASKIFLRPNLLHDSRGMPTVFVHKLGQDLAHCHDTGMFATDFDSLLHHWATDGLNYYVLAKLLWDPHANVDAIVAEYCQKGFGPAANEVRAYFDGLERLTDRIAEDTERDPESRDHMADLAPRHYTPEALAELRRHLEEGRNKAKAAGVEDVVKRIDFLLLGLRFGEVNAEALRAWQAYQSGGDGAAAQKALEARYALYAEIGTSLAVNLVDVYYRQSRWTQWGRLPLPRVQ